MVLDALPYGNEIVAVAVILVSVVIAKTATFALRRSLGRVTRMTSTQLDDILLAAVSRPLFVGIVLGGLLTAAHIVPILLPYAAEVDTAFSVLFTLFGLWLAVRIVNGVVEWYATDIAAKTHSKKDDQFLPIVRKVILAVFGFIALLMILGQFGIEITSLIAALGIGGLAVALALQPTLSNFFSGAYIVMDKVVRIGDFVEVDDTTKGTVADISWRSTKIKTFTNNILIIPNSRLADSIITAYSQPNNEMGFSIPCGVGYGEDLERVEKVTLQEARKVMAMDGGVKNFEPFVRFREFGDSNINFSVILRATTRGTSFRLRHEFIKALKKRFDKEGIEIAWPTRKIYYGTPQKKKS